MKIQTYIKKQLKNQQGYLTIELTLVFSAIFFALLMILFMGMALYQQVNLQSLAVKTSARGAVIYGSRTKDMESGVRTLADFENRDPYRYLSSIFGGDKTAEYKNILNTYVAQNVGDYNILTGEAKNRDYVTVQDYVLIKRIKVNIKEDYHMPTDAIARMFGSDGAFHIDTTAMSTVAEPVEFVRNVDMCVDILQQTKAFDKAQEAVQKVHKYIGDFTDLLKKE